MGDSHGKSRFGCGCDDGCDRRTFLTAMAAGAMAGFSPILLSCH
jgi:hypothetical protein